MLFQAKYWVYLLLLVSVNDKIHTENIVMADKMFVFRYTSKQCCTKNKLAI